MIGHDKILHFIVGFFLSLTGLVFFPFVILGFIFAFAKELYDYYTKKGIAEINDIISTVIGASFAVIIILII